MLIIGRYPCNASYQRQKDSSLTDWFVGRSGSGLSILLGPLSGSLDGSVLVLFPSLGDVVGERVIGVGRTEQSLDGKQDSADLQGGRPVA
jgi:hypothetical protein